MLAMIMAGGEGERLRPLTCTCPKPMVRVLDKPLLSYCFELLKRHGVRKAALTLGYLPDVIMDEYEDGDEIGVELAYYLEKQPLGTAGGVKRARDFLTDTFCVLSGDGLTDADLTKAYDFHKSRGALATMILKRVSNPTEYGLVQADAEGRVKAFIEKPSWSGVTTDTANTGIYIMEPEVLDFIPGEGAYDFGRELFPALLKREQRVYGYIEDAYWCDIGDIPAYLRAHEDALSGRVSTISMPENGILRMPGAIVDESARIEAPVYIGEGARIASGARITMSAIGAGAVIGENASVKRSVMYPYSRAGAETQLRGCVLANGTELGGGASAYEDCVIGEDSRLGARASLQPGVMVWPFKRVREGAKLAENLVWGQRDARAFHGVTMHAKTPEAATRAGRMLAWKLKLKTVLVGRAASAVASAQEHAVSAGLAAQGARVYTAGECTLPQLRLALASVRADAAVYALSDGITPIRADLAYLSAEDKRRLDAALNRQDAPPPYTGITRPIESAGRFDLQYLGFLEGAAAGAIRRARAAVFAQDKQLLYLAEHAFERAGFDARVEWEEDMMDLDDGETGVYLSLDGESARFADENGLLSDAQSEWVTAWAMAEHGERVIYAPPGATRALDALTKSLGLNVVYANNDMSAWARELNKNSPYQFSMRFDGLYLALNALTHLSEKGLALADLTRRMPPVERASRQVEVSFDKRGEVMRKLREAAPDEFVRDDMFFMGKRGCAWIAQDDDRPVCVVTAEARDAEFAREICDMFSDLLAKSAEE